MIETPPRAWGRRLSVIAYNGQTGNTPTGVGKTIHSRHGGTNIEKHPHGRGEDLIWYLRVHLGMETPPRAWGRQGNSCVFYSAQGNTPTGVGKTAVKIDKLEGFGKHPHGRGEDKCALWWSRKKQETPPRAWGRHICIHLLDHFGRNTPTGVGKTLDQHPFLTSF